MGVVIIILLFFIVGILAYGLVFLDASLNKLESIRTNIIDVESELQLINQKLQKFEIENEK